MSRWVWAAVTAGFLALCISAVVHDKRLETRRIEARNEHQRLVTEEHDRQGRASSSHIDKFLKWLVR